MRFLLIMLMGFMFIAVEAKSFHQHDPPDEVEQYVSSEDLEVATFVYDLTACNGCSYYSEVKNSSNTEFKVLEAHAQIRHCNHANEHYFKHEFDIYSKMLCNSNYDMELEPDSGFLSMKRNC